LEVLAAAVGAAGEAGFATGEIGPGKSGKIGGVSKTGGGKLGVAAGGAG